MRILHVIEAFRTGGKERQLIELLKGLQTEPDVFCEVVTIESGVEYDAFLTLGVKHHDLRRSARYDLSAIPKLARIIRDFRPDIVHSWGSMCSVYLAPLSLLFGVSFVEGSIRGAPPHPTLSDKDFRRYLLTSKVASAVVANSAAGLRAYRVPVAKGRVIRNGFDPTRNATPAEPAHMRRQLGILTPLAVAMVGAYAERKDHETYFEVARRICALRSDVTFLAIGEGPTLGAYRQALPPAEFPRIKQLGRRSDIESILSAVDVGVLCSLAGEGIPNAVMEYMAFAKPVVATDIGGTNELLVDGETGFLVRVSDPEDLMLRVLQLLDDRALAMQFGQAGRERLATNFGLTRLVKEHLVLYNDLLASRRRKPLGERRHD